MKDIKYIELIDDIRRDALILMEKDKSLDYFQASEMAKKKLIGDSKVTEANISPFSLNIDENLLHEENEIIESADPYYDDLKNKMKDIIDVSKFDKEQLKQLVIGREMGLSNEDILKVSDNKYNAEQIKYLCVLISCGKDISRFIGDYSFNPVQAFAELVSIK